jgi:hypothetical protein
VLSKKKFNKIIKQVKNNKNNNLNKLKNSRYTCVDIYHHPTSAERRFTTTTLRVGLTSSPKVKKLDILLRNTNLLEQFYQWFVGVSDGESSFTIAKKSNLDKTKFTFFFQIVLHVDDFKVLEYIHKTLNLGSLTINAQGDECKFIVTKMEELERIIVIFDKHNLNTLKYLNYIDWRKAFFLYRNREGLVNTDLVKEILDIKNKMNNNRVDFSYPLEHKIVITPFWLLGFVEAEGSFYVTKLLEPAFAIALNEKESALIQSIKEFLIENLNFDDHSKWKLKESGLIGIHNQKARGTTKGAVRIIIRNILILNNYLIPFFSCLEFKSKKGLDFEDFKLICNNIYIGAHLNQEIKVSLLRLINTMNNKRLSNSKTTHTPCLTKDELVLLNNLKPVYKHLPDGSVINMDSGKKVSQYSIYVLTYENGEIKRVSTRDEIASELNVSLTTISKHLNLNPEGVTFKNCHVKKIGVFSK